jgi:TPP-dependent pyruvate/acetoin dehydrogenase alpha subunit
MRAGVLDEERAAEIKQEALETMRAGIADAEAEPPADVGLVFEHAYANPPDSFAGELAELRKVLES